MHVFGKIEISKCGLARRGIAVSLIAVVRSHSLVALAEGAEGCIARAAFQRTAAAALPPPPDGQRRMRWLRLAAAAEVAGHKIGRALRFCGQTKACDAEGTRRQFASLVALYAAEQLRDRSPNKRWPLAGRFGGCLVSPTAGSRESRARLSQRDYTDTDFDN